MNCWLFTKRFSRRNGGASNRNRRCMQDLNKHHSIADVQTNVGLTIVVNRRLHQLSGGELKACSLAFSRSWLWLGWYPCYSGTLRRPKAWSLASDRHSSASIRRFRGTGPRRRLQTYPSLHVPLQGRHFLGCGFFDSTFRHFPTGRFWIRATRIRKHSARSLNVLLPKLWDLKQSAQNFKELGSLLSARYFTICLRYRALQDWGDNRGSATVQFLIDAGR